MDMRQNRDLQLNELEQTLAKESQRAADLKVQQTFLKDKKDKSMQQPKGKRFYSSSIQFFI